MKTFMAGLNVDDYEEEIFIEANSEAEAIEKMVYTYGFDSEQVIIYGEVSEEYADMLGYDTY